MLVPPKLHVAVDIGCRRHSVAIGLSSGERLEEFDIEHRPEGFADFFRRIERHTGVTRAASPRSRWKATTATRARSTP